MPGRPNFQTISHIDLSRGIDQRSSPNAVKPGFAEDMRNLDTNSTGFVEKRKGYQGYKGCLPIRIEDVDVNEVDSKIEFTLNSDISLLNTSSTPIVVYGKILQTGSGTIATTAGSTAIVGTGTTFTTELQVGSVLYVTDTSESQVVKSITDDTNLTVGAAFGQTDASSAYTHRTPKEYYWDSFVNESRQQTSAGDPAALMEIVHGFGTTSLAAGLVYAPTSGSLDNYSVYADSLVLGADVDKIAVTVDNSGTTEDRDFYVLLEDLDATDVTTYRAAISESLTSGSATFTVPLATHILPNLHIIPFLYAETSAGEFTFVLPEDFTVKVNGDVEITINNADFTVGGASTFEGKLVMIDVPTIRSLEGSYSPGSPETLTFTGVENDFSFYAFYKRGGSGEQIQVIPTSVFHDETTKELIATFEVGVAANLKMVYTPAIIKANVINVDRTGYTEMVDDTTPSASMWGIPHADITYPTSTPRGSWTNSIEEYSAQGNNKLVVGMNGNLHEEIDPTYDGVTLPRYFIDIRRRSDEEKTLGPFFGDVAGKVRGIEGVGVNNSTSAATITSITNNGDGTATLGLGFAGKFGTLSDLVTTASSTGNDRITITNAGNPEYVGTFDITAVSETLTHAAGSSYGMTTIVRDSADQITVTFNNNANAVAFHALLVDDSTWAWQAGNNDIYIMLLGTGGAASLDPGLGTTITVDLTAGFVTLLGEFTDFDNVTTTTYSVTDKNITLEAQSATSTITINVPDIETYTPNETDIGASGVISTDSIIMSELNEAGGSEDLPFLVNDTVVGTLFTFTTTVIGVDADTASTRRLYMSGFTSNITIPISAQINAGRTSATQVLSSVSHIVRGDTLAASGYTREFQVLSVDPVANSVTLDESIFLEDDPADRDHLSVTGRWLPIEAPNLNDQPISYFDQKDVNEQDRLRGVSIGGSIFYTNYNDDVMKYDGANIYRAGLMSWQPRTHSWVDNDAAGIPIPEVQYLAAEASGNLLRFSPGSYPDLTGVSELYFVGDDGVNTTATAGVKIVNTDATDHTITLDSSDLTLVNAGRGHISIPSQAAYYFKLQMIDRNQNLIASAVTDFQECVVDITQSGTVTHVLTGLPKFDIYDYDRIDLMVYRTLIGQTATPPFFEVKRVPIDFELAMATNSITIIDNVPNKSLPSVPDDTISIALKGAELPISSDQPPRCKYLATLDNRLVLGNTKSYNRLDVTLRSDSGITEDNVMGNSTVNLTDGTNSKTFEFFDFVDGAGTALNATNNMRITDIDFTTSATQFELTFTGDIGYDLTGKFIQISSFYMDAAGTDLYTSSGRTRESDLGRIIGWWKVDSHATGPSPDTLIVKYTHGITSDYTFGGANNPMYMTFPDSGSDNVPIAAVPYAISAVNRIITDVVYDDTTKAFEFTNAVNRGVRDLKQALNRVMVEETTPWAYGLSGTTEGNGRIIFESALPGKILTTTISEGGSTDLEIFVNNIRRASGTPVDGLDLVFPSRILISTPNFPEMFDAPFAKTTAESDSLLDINSDDGQEITGMATFFGDSTSAHGQLQSTLLVFKNKSVYVINVLDRTFEKLESMGQGCTVPDSISATQDGIMFANQSGIYKVDRNLRITYVGRWVERYWDDEVGSSTVEDVAFGFSDSTNRNYKLSVPIGTSTKNSEVAVLDYVVEGQSEGSWTIYDNFPANGWVQTNVNSYFGSYDGRVFALRVAEDNTDYRDDASAITSSFTYGAQSFGDTGSRAILNRVVSHFHAETALTGTDLGVATDMNKTFTSTDSITFTANSDDPKLFSVANSVPERHALYFQLKYTHGTLDENFILAGIDFKVEGIGELGIPQAKEIST